MLTLDTSGFLALLNQQDRNHERCKVAFENDGGPYFLPAVALGELSWFLQTRYTTEVERTVLQDMHDGAYAFDCGDGDIPRIKELLERYHDQRMGIADFGVIACAERHGGQVLTTDYTHFSLIARGEGTIIVLPYPW